MRGKVGDHPRNTGPMRDSPRCGARTRKGTPCQSPAVSGKARCRMHGGAKGSGAPMGNTNALKHGMYTKAALEEQNVLRRMIREMEESLLEIEES
jgi:uncharacterized protein YjcR